MKKQLARVLALCAGLTLVGSATACSAAGPSNEETIKVTVGVSANMAANNSPLAVVQHFGFFEQEGLDVEIIVTGDSTASVQGPIQGRLDISSTPIEPILQVQSASDEEAELVMVYNYVREQTGSLATLAGSGISSMTDFEGKTIGVSDLGSSNILLTNGTLSSVGLVPGEDFEYLAVGTGAAALQALEAGHVDGLALWDTEYAAMEKAGAQLEFFTTPEIQSLFSTTWFTTRGYLEDNPEVVEAFGRAMAKATYFVSLDPEATLRIMYEDYPETISAGRTLEEQLEVDLTSLGARVLLLTANDPHANRTWGYYEPGAVEAWVDFAYESGIIPNRVDPSVAFTNEFVEGYNDFDPSEVEQLLQ